MGTRRDRWRAAVLLLGPVLLAVLLVSWLAGSRAAAPPPRPLSAQQRTQKVKEIVRLMGEESKLIRAGKLTEATTVMEKLVALQRQLFGDTHQEVVSSLENLADWHEAREDFAAAQKARRELLAIQTKRFGAGHWRVTDERLKLEHTRRLARLTREQRQRLARADKLHQDVQRLYQQGKAREALPLAQQALAIRKELLGATHPHYAAAVNNLAKLYVA